ncbi:sushi, von Willebrand factor type A, EGF and pentraxin domain-containing protein 1-like [Octopus bimaculoides]|nr:sushi, von Willebrand factor type A, EGF and pentraxin domain-containing protein 1-like [Octopus bimaculoides]
MKMSTRLKLHFMTKLYAVSVALSLLLMATTAGAKDSQLGERYCFPPWEPINGHYNIWGDGLLVEFECNKGFNLVGDSFGACDTEAGIWTVSTPLCLGTKCKVPKYFAYGQITIKHNGGMITFDCKAGYHLFGSRTLQCDGTKWNTTLPACLKNRGKYPSSYMEKLINAKRQRLQYRKNNMTSLLESDDSCNTERIDPPAIENARFRTSFYYNVMNMSYVMFATYQCVTGYKLRYADMRHLYCQNRKWRAPVFPECIKNMTACEKNNGGCQQMCVIREHGYSCECRTGFTLGENRRNCIDFNECIFNNGNCHQVCYNTPGSFFCGCRPGYIMDKGICKG